MTTLERNRWSSFVAAMLVSGIAVAQGFPSRTIRLVSGVTPGSASDTTARIVAEKLQAGLGQVGIAGKKPRGGWVNGAAHLAATATGRHSITFSTPACPDAPLPSPVPID